MDSGIIEESKKQWNSDELLSDEINLLLDNVPKLDSMFNIKSRIGQGAFSTVYLAVPKCKTNLKNQKYAIKHVIPTSHPSRIFTELKCLKMFGGKDNIMQLISCIRCQNHIVMVMPYFHHDSFSDLAGKLSVCELRNYIENLLIALKIIHKEKIIHRDIKPSNFLYSRKLERCALIDFGLAESVNGSERAKSHNATSVPHFDTPFTNSSRIVKRKLSVVSPEVSLNKKSPLKSSLNVTSNLSIPSSVSSNLLSQMVRRSRKLQTSLQKSPGKDNYLFHASNQTNSIQDSPSKHTRRAESMKNLEGTFSKMVNGFEKSSISGSSGLKRKRSTLDEKQDFKLTTPNYNLGKKSSIQQNKPKTVKNMFCNGSCKCYGTYRICEICCKKKSQHAPRAGTPGFRAPEILLRYPHQTQAVDMWSVGVIFVCLLSGRYPFFQAVDDMTSLSQITTVFGTKAIKKVASKLDKQFIYSENKPALDLEKICEKLRRTSSASSLKDTARIECTGCHQMSNCICKKVASGVTASLDVGLDVSKHSLERKEAIEAASHWNKKSTLNDSSYPTSAYDLLHRLLDPDPFTRISAEEALQHPFITLVGKDFHGFP